MRFEDTFDQTITTINTELAAQRDTHIGRDDLTIICALYTAAIVKSIQQLMELDTNQQEVESQKMTAMMIRKVTDATKDDPAATANLVARMGILALK